jgi:hypothetical protein
MHKTPHQNDKAEKGQIDRSRDQAIDHAADLDRPSGTGWAGILAVSLLVGHRHVSDELGRLAA